MKSYSSYQFSLFRIILGSYLLWHFCMLIPYAAEIWSNQGIFPDPAMNLTHGYFPNLLNLIASPTGVTCYIGLLALLSLAFLVGYQRRIVSILLWYGWATLFDRNNLIINPGIPYVGWLLLCCAAIPKGEPLSLTKNKTSEPWSMPTILYVGAWVLMSLGYTLSGIDKLGSPSWTDGTAMYHLLENPLARDSWIRSWAAQLPTIILQLKTWLVLFLEIAFLPLALFPKTRKWIWLAMICMHFGILLIIDFSDLTLGMLMIHWFTFDSRWFKAKPKETGILYFDGVCEMCNSLVNFLLPIDQNNTLSFAPLQGTTAEKNVDQFYRENLNTIVYQENDKTYIKSDAIIKSISSLGGIWSLIKVLKLIPRSLRNYVYTFTSKNRYNWFGKQKACKILSPTERARILA